VVSGIKSILIPETHLWALTVPLQTLLKMVKLSKFKEYFKESKAHWHMMKLEQDIKNLEKRLKLEEDLEKRLGYFYNHSLKKKVLISRINELKSRVDCLDENMDSPTVYTVKTID
jgi:ABC-type Na+ transport system ATPase subunit NatA